MEFSFRELRRNVIRKARSEKRDASRVVDIEARLGQIYPGEKIHAINIGKGGHCENKHSFAL